MDLSSLFSLPLLIYDDKCSSCTKFAKIVKILSRGRIRILGHYYSKEAIEAKKIIFPPNYDPTTMFWLINDKGAYGSRSGLGQVVKEIIIGWFKGKNMKNNNNSIDNQDNNFISHELSCEYTDSLRSCDSTKSIVQRIVNLLKNSKKFHFSN